MPGDSIQAKSDTMDDVAPWARVCSPDQAPFPVCGRDAYVTGRVPYSMGMHPEPRALLPGYDSGVICMLLAAFVLLAANFRHYSTYLRNLPANLWSVKTRDNVFDDSHTLSETRMLMAMIVIVCVCEGLLAYSLLRAYISPEISISAGAAMATACAAVFYFARLAAYGVAGYIFAAPRGAALWIKGFNASQSLLGMLLVVPALWVLFNPGASTAMAVTGGAACFLCRLLFICKGFRIFYDKTYSLVYFILYLCTLEIAPLFAIWRGVLAFTDCL